MTPALTDLLLATQRFDLRIRTTLSFVIDCGGSVTEALLYKAMFANRLTPEEASAVVSSLLVYGLMKRVGSVALAVTDEGCRYVDGVKQLKGGM